MSNLIQFYNDDKKTELAYPLVHKNGIVNEDGSSVIETIEKKITLNMNELKENMNDTYGNNINEIKEDVKDEKIINEENERKVNALIKMGEGVTHEFKKDNETAYIKDIPRGAKLASIKKIGGRSLVWNQYSNVINKETGWCYDIADKDKIAELRSHKLYVFYKTIISSIIVSDADAYERKILFHGNISQIAVGYTRLTKDKIIVNYGQENREIITAPSDLTDIWGYNYGYDTVGTYARCKTFINIIDLTRMFGFGNEPTNVSDFEDYLREACFENASPFFVNNKINKITIHNRNLLKIKNDEFKKCLSYDTMPLDLSHGKYKLILEKNLWFNETYPFDNTTAQFVTYFVSLIRYDNGGIYKFYSSPGFNTNNKLNGQNPILEYIINITAHAPFLAYYSGSKDKDYNKIFNTFWGKSMIVKEGFSTEYVSSIETTYDIPEEILNLDGYGWGINDEQYNEVDFVNKKYIQRVGKIKIINTTPIYKNTTDENNWLYYIKVKNSSTNRTEIISNLFPTMASSESFLVEKSMCGISSSTTSGGVIYFNPLNLITENTTKAVLKYLVDNNCEFYYPLEKPIITDISDLIPEGFLESLEVEEGGNIVFKYEDTGVNINVKTPSSIEYISEISKE